MFKNAARGMMWASASGGGGLENDAAAKTGVGGKNIARGGVEGAKI